MKTLSVAQNIETNAVVSNIDDAIPNSNPPFTRCTPQLQPPIGIRALPEVINICHT